MNKVIILSLISILVLASCRKKLDLDTVFLGLENQSACGDFALTVYNNDNSIGLCVYADSSDLELDEISKTFTITPNDTDLVVVVDEFRQGRGWFDCWTIENNYNLRSHRWIAESGTVRISARDFTNLNHKYRVTVILEDLVFRHETDDDPDAEVTLDYEAFLDIPVDY